MTIVSISITGPTPDLLAELARTLVADRLVACGNIIPEIRSIYRWGDAVEDEPEAYLTLHTQAARVDAIIVRTNELHPYDTVQILATEIAMADPAYRQWVLDETEPPADTTAV